MGKKERFESPVGSMLKYIDRYNLDHVMKQCIDGANWEDINKLKQNVKNVIKIREHFSWRASCMLYQELRVYLQGFSI